MNDNPTLMVIDGHSLAFRAFYALPIESFVAPGGQHTNAIHGFISMFLGLLRKEQPSHVAVAFDLSRFSFRTRIYPEYKATRGETPREFIGQIPLLQDALHSMGLVTVTKEDFEADDIIATLAREGSQANFDVLVVSGDRDTFQLVSDQVTVLYPSARGVSELKRYSPEAVQERYGVAPEQYPDIAALVGETSDNLVGVEKVGEKTAVKWLQKYGSLEAILNSADEIPGVVGQNLRDQKDRVVRNRELNQLRTDVDLGLTLESLRFEGIRAEEVSDVFGRLGFRTLTRRVLELGESMKNPEETNLSRETDLSLPKEIALPGFDLKKWIGAQDSMLGLSVKIKDKEILEIGVASDSESATLPWPSEPTDREKLIDILLSRNKKWIVHDAKPILKNLFSEGIPLRIAGDTAILEWIKNPAVKIMPLVSIAEEVLAYSMPSQNNDLSLLDEEEDSVSSGLRAFFTIQLWNQGISTLDESSKSVLEKIEMPLIRVLAEMETAGIACSADQLRTLANHLAQEIARHQSACFKAIGKEVNLGSPKQLQTVLFDDLGLPKTRATKTGYSTDARAIQELQGSNPHPFLDSLLAHRDATKLHQIVEGLAEEIGDDARIHTSFDQTGTSTGRLSSLKPNLQNIPVQTDVGHKIRSSFGASPGSDGLLTADYSQIEMRIMAHLSGDRNLIEAFQKGEDLHRYVGAKIFQVEPESVTPIMRTKVKAMSYGLAYGLSAYGLAQQLSISPSEAKELMTSYFERFEPVRRYLRKVVDQAREEGFTETLFGRRRPFPDLSSTNRMARQAAERQALNAPIQGTAADIIKIAMRDIGSDLRANKLKSEMILQVHDELVFEVRNGERTSIEGIVATRMSGAAELLVPLEVQIGWGSNWHSAAH